MGVLAEESRLPRQFVWLGGWLTDSRQAQHIEHGIGIRKHTMLPLGTRFSSKSSGSTAYSSPSTFSLIPGRENTIEHQGKVLFLCQDDRAQGTLQVPTCSDIFGNFSRHPWIPQTHPMYFQLPLLYGPHPRQSLGCPPPHEEACSAEIRPPCRLSLKGRGMP